MAKVIAKKKPDRVHVLIKEVEDLARTLRAEVRKRAKAAGVPHGLQAMARRLRVRAAAVAGLIEKQMHQLRKGIEGAPRRPAAKRAKPAKRKAKPAAAAVATP